MLKPENKGKVYVLYSIDEGAFLFLMYGLSALAAVALIVAIVALLQSRALSREMVELHRQATLSEQRLVKLEKALIQQQELIHGLRSNGFGVHDDVKALDTRLAALESQQMEIVSKQTEFEHQEASSPLYTRAAKLVDSGATVDELMEECDLPRAEAELLISLRAK